MITFEDVKNLVKKFPELELVDKKDFYDKTHHYCVMKETHDFEVFEFHTNSVEPYIFLNHAIPVRASSEEGRIYRLKGDAPYGVGYDDLNELDKPLKRVVFMLNQLILAQKRMKIYEKKLDLEKDFKE